MRVADAQPCPDAELVHYGVSYAVWDRFTATIEPDDPKLPICHLTIAVEHGRAVCEELRAERGPDHQPITGTALRESPLGEYVKLAAGKVAKLAVLAPAGEPLALVTETGEKWPIHVQRIDDEWVAIPTAGLERSKHFLAESRNTRRREHGGRVTDEELRKVADIYRAAHVERRAPTAAVASELYVSRSTAGRYVQRARARGFLGPTRPRVAGEST